MCDRAALANTAAAKRAENHRHDRSARRGAVLTAAAPAVGRSNRPGSAMPCLRIRLAIVALLATGCSSHDLPPLSPVRGQTVAQQAIDAEACASQVESAARAIGVTRITGWSDEERYTYLACMEGRGYAK